VIGAEALPTHPALTGALLLMAGLGLVALVRREAVKTAPLIPLDLLRLPPFRIAAIASVCCFVGQTTGVVALPFYLQHGLKQSTLTIGLCMTAWPLAVACTAPAAGWLSDRTSTAWLCAAGGGVMALGLAAAALLPMQQDPRWLAACTALCGLGFGLFNVPNNRTLFLSAPRERSGAAGGLQGAARLAGQTTGALIMTLLLAACSIDTAPRIGLLIGAGLALGAGLISILRTTRSLPVAA
jgi:DHA2 family multidrug resistance protein-like MFS transporter